MHGNMFMRAAWGPHLGVHSQCHGDHSVVTFQAQGRCQQTRGITLEVWVDWQGGRLHVT
jgi:hypothetical protein